MISSRIENVFLFHGKGGRPTGSVLQLEELLRPRFQTINFVRPELLHGDPAIAAEESLENLFGLDIPQGSAIIGISLGGLLAAKLQESSRVAVLFRAHSQAARVLGGVAVPEGLEGPAPFTDGAQPR
jgi:predicted esterase YcpF (UPF0227 family)